MKLADFGASKLALGSAFGALFQIKKLHMFDLAGCSIGPYMCFIEVGLADFRASKLALGVLYDEEIAHVQSNCTCQKQLRMSKAIAHAKSNCTCPKQLHMPKAIAHVQSNPTCTCFITVGSQVLRQTP